MSQATHPPETDLIAPRPAEGEEWDPATVHTHYFGFHIEDAAIGCFAYIRYLPALNHSHAGFLAYQGMDNLTLPDAAHHDYKIGHPWPEIDGNRFSANGLTFEFTEPGRTAQITYRSSDGNCSVDVTAEAVTPLAVRGHVMPGEEHHKGQEPGGSEQFMHYTGELKLNGETYEVDCNAARDRSWRQVRAETLEANSHPPILWTPVYFGPDLAINQVGFAAPDTGPLWQDHFQLPDDAPTFHFAWVSVNDEVRNIVRVHRRDTEIHPTVYAPLRTEIEAEDEKGDTYVIKGEAIAFCPLPSWPNLSSWETLFRWEDEQGRTACGPGQSVWNHVAHKAMRAKAGATSAVA